MPDAESVLQDAYKVLTELVRKDPCRKHIQALLAIDAAIHLLRGETPQALERIADIKMLLP